MPNYRKNILVIYVHSILSGGKYKDFRKWYICEIIQHIACNEQFDNLKIENVPKVCLDTPIIYSIAEDTGTSTL